MSDKKIQMPGFSGTGPIPILAHDNGDGSYSLSTPQTLSATDIANGTATTPPLSTDMLPLARLGDNTARKISVGNFLANAPSPIGVTVSNPLVPYFLLNNVSAVLKASAGIQPAITVGGKETNEGGGYFEVHSGDDTYWSRFQQYQYGASLRSNNRLYEIMLNDHGGEIPTLGLTNNGNVLNEHINGARIQIRDKTDSGGINLDASVLAAAGSASINIDGAFAGAKMQMFNLAVDGFIEFGQVGADSVQRASVKIGQLTGYLNYFLIAPARTLGDTARGGAFLHLIKTDGSWAGNNDARAMWISGDTVTRRLMLTYDTVGNYGIIQAADAADDVKPLNLNPSGGKVGIGTLTPKSALHVVGLPTYANNAAATGAGLTAGAFYRSNADPDVVCVVH